jgi:hypothetical protein
MFDSLTRDPGTYEWRNDNKVRELQDDLSRTRKELELLRDTTARMLAAILTELHNRPEPMIGAAPEIQELTDLREPAEGGDVVELTTGEIDVIDLTNRESFAHLDRRFRWLPARRARN